MTIKNEMDSVKPLVLDVAMAKEFRDNPEALAKTIVVAINDKASIEDLAIILHDVILYAYIEGFLAGRERGN